MTRQGKPVYFGQKTMELVVDGGHYAGVLMRVYGQRRIVYTRATAATVYRWATGGKRRRRTKYRNAITVCRVLNRREAPVMGMGNDGYGVLGHVKFDWGAGHVRDCGPWIDIYVDPNGATERYWGWHTTESRRVLRGRHKRTT